MSSAYQCFHCRAVVPAGMNHNCSRTNETTAPVDQRLFQIGDMVQRKEPRSYLFPGVVIAAGYKLDGVTWHCEVECIAPGVEGMTHVFPARSLETRAEQPRPTEALANADYALAQLPADREACNRALALRTRPATTEGDGLREALSKGGFISTEPAPTDGFPRARRLVIGFVNPDDADDAMAVVSNALKGNVT